MKAKTKALVAMSGGVDSSVAAALMVERGFETSGVTLKLLPRAETGFGCCGSPADVDDARRVCEKLGVRHYVVDMAALFEDRVIRPFIDSYLSARTPNPCVECNRSVKFGHLLALAEAWGFDVLATGHYARAEGGRLFKAADDKKDQTYFLHALSARELSRVTFPVGELAKAQVREKARALGLKTADKPESQEICFVPARDYRAFIASRVRTEEQEAFKSGPVVDTEGKVLGRHEGTISYTLGQRRGLSISSPEPRYVVRLEPESGTVVVGSDEEAQASSCVVENVGWTAGRPPEDSNAQVRIRHRHVPAPARLSLLEGGRVSVSFDAPQRAVTPGQAAVFYRGAEVLGGGTISRN